MPRLHPVSEPRVAAELARVLWGKTASKLGGYTRLPERAAFPSRVTLGKPWFFC